LSGEGYGVQHPDDGSSVWLAPTASLLARWNLSKSVVFVARVGASAPLLHPRFTLEDIGTVNAAAALAVRTSLGLDFR
jgi:hypothetical protein